jgi:hypothetical protein
MATTLHSQIIASTDVDAHGEQCTREFLEELAVRMPPKMPLNQHHDHARPTVGMIENFRVVQEANGWALVADVTFDGEPPSLGGLSYSTTELTRKDERSVLAAYVPFPYYKDEQFLADLGVHDGGTSVGRWIKKAEKVAQVALVVSALNLLLGPAWRRIYEDRIHPHLAGLARTLRDGLKARGAAQVRVEFLQPVRCEQYDGTIELYFIPSEHVEPSVTYDFVVAEAIGEAEAFVAGDWEGSGKTIKRIVHIFDIENCRYTRTQIIYTDGTSRMCTRVCNREHG